MVLLFLSMSNLLIGQNTYYVFKKSGEPFFYSNKPLERGSNVSAGDTLFLGKTDYILLVNQLGELFELKEPNEYIFSQLLNFRRRFHDESLTKKYFAYVWKQFTNQTKKRQDAGVVYREDHEIKLLNPRDSVKVYNPELTFNWVNNTDTDKLFFFLKDLESNRITKFGVTGNSLTLFLDNYLLTVDKEYDWAVAKISFPNLNQLKFNNLKILTKEEYKRQLDEMAIIIKAFRLLGFTEEEIKKAICIDYKLCMF